MNVCALVRASLSAVPDTPGPEYRNPLERLFQVGHGEWPRFALAFCYFFFLLGGYFMLRPLRGTVASNNSDILHLLYTATFVTMLLLVPAFGFLVSRFRRGIFVPASYLLFLCQLGLFVWAFSGDEPSALVQRTFYVWVSVFNLFVVSVFWSFMADIFRPDQAQRLFGSIMAGGSLGAISGPLATAGLATQIGSSGVMMMAMACLLLATVLAITLGRFEHHQGSGEPEEVIGGGIFEGAVTVFRSHYLLLICALMLSHNLVSTFLYNGLAVLVNQEIVGFDQRTVFFSQVDLVVQVLAFTLQLLITSRLLQHLGMPRTAIIPPVLLAAGFTFLGSSMGLVLFAAVQVAQRSMNYGILGPVKQMLFTVVDRQSKYKSKNFIDTVVYRGSDVVASWLFKGLTLTGLSLGFITFTYLPILLIWSTAAWRLGKGFERLRASIAQSLESGSDIPAKDG